ncbi:MAG TPA: trypsin-like peptidase domain-containing protein [Cellulomonas sp.]|uniref:S1C family serine protease n=1 Tax=Cellulomonas sp. TaxID=40001 RepID=UPI002E2F6ED3|nr:trypsin-like peptidase domain-containing protein [Cellulomonas sp.]HEX5332856.1 trypsin-like peptidase domain-containing protein [Cellulomonas sp.]
MSTAPEVPGSAEPEQNAAQTTGGTTPVESAAASEHPAATAPPAATEHPTQPLPPTQVTQPLPPTPPAQPANPFLPPQPAPGVDPRVHYAAQQYVAAQQHAAAQHAAAQEAAARQHAAAAQHHAARSGADPFLAPGQAPGQASGATEPGAVPTQARRSIWLPVTAAAAGAALLASFGTAALTHAFDDGTSNATPASFATIGQSTNSSVPVAGSTSDNPDWQKVAAAVQASVVAIEVTTTSGSAQGSGVILDKTGNIITNNHVVEGAQGDVSVTLTDGRVFKATIVGKDATTDLAVIKLKDAPSDLSPAALGDSGAIVVGQPVMAVGNPLGLANTVTTGIVSAVDRPVSTSTTGSSSDAVVTNAIQIDAAVNPGNSGGPLFDAEGRVVGITSSIATLSSSSGSIGLGFAIPVNLVKNIAAQLVASGSAQHAFLGVSLSDGTATVDNTTRLGAVVQEVTAGSPAANASLQAKDVIVAIDGKPVGGAESLTAYVRGMASGAQATLTVVRDGKAIDVKVTLATKAATTPSSDSTTPTDPRQMTPDQLYKWYQEQQQQGQGGTGQG